MGSNSGVVVESIALNTYFAVELFSVEQPRDVAYLICKAGDEAKTLFRRLELLDVMFLGGRRFARCRSDLLNPYPMLETLHGRGRSIICAQANQGYQVRFIDGRRGPVPNITMHCAPKVGQRVSYKGPKIKLWSRQFE